MQNLSPLWLTRSKAVADGPVGPVLAGPTFKTGFN